MNSHCSAGATEPVKSKQTAERVWEPKFLGEIMAGRDPRIAPNEPDTTSVLTVADFLDPPLLSTTPFHRFGVTIKARDETKRDRRVHRDEEQRLLTACVAMNSAAHKFAGPARHDRIIGALETCCRQGEMLRIQNRHVEWPQHQIMIPGANAKDAENRRIRSIRRGGSRRS